MSIVVACKTCYCAFNSNYELGTCILGSDRSAMYVGRHMSLVKVDWSLFIVNPTDGYHCA